MSQKLTADEAAELLNENLKEEGYDLRARLTIAKALSEIVSQEAAILLAAANEAKAKAEAEAKARQAEADRISEEINEIARLKGLLNG